MAQAPPQVQIILVDTNCYLRLYCAAIRPILGNTFSGHRLLITRELHREFDANQALSNRYTWMSDPATSKERRKAIVPLGELQRIAIDGLVPVIQSQATAVLAAYCLANQMAVVSLSRADRRLVATADVLNCKMATDEWPMTLVANQLGFTCLNSLDVLSLMEQSAALTAAQRVATVLAWVRNDEKLPRGWQQLYQRIFGEQPPVANPLRR